MTTAKFLAWEPRQETKWEFDGIAPVAMTGSTFAHSRIQGNLVTALNNRLRGGPCQPAGPDIRVPTGEGRYRYPDALVTCTHVVPQATEVADPVVLFEVMSDGTTDTNWTAKLVEYQSIPSLRSYVMVEQSMYFVTVITRAATGWSIDVLQGGDTLRLPEIGVEVPVADLYIGLDAIV